MFKQLIMLSIGLSIVSSCVNEGIEGSYIKFEKPINFPEPTYDFSVNEFTQEKFELGKRLFYEGRLSADNSISCGFCHNQAQAFTHHGHDLSAGVGGTEGTRNTQPIQNLAFMNDFTWDGAIRHLDLQPLVPIESPLEMKETVSNVLGKLQADASYVSDFKKSFVKTDSESHIVNLRTLTQALSQFMNALVSSNSRYDQYVRGEAMEVPYSEEEKKGLAVFNEKCASCHAGELFTDQSFRNNGLGVNSKFPDELGRGRVNDEDNGVNSSDYYKFKVPSLRNVWITYPYMHDGRLADLDAVFEHYNSGVVEMATLDPTLKNGEVLGIPLSETDKTELKYFLKSLTDETFINDSRFSE
ncbi:cytochrome-c peroxidase [Flavicella sediminum]|uniref:cytochrome-c peroxidase n=1 Tax=Flavicella sediminum TaxID=2585141 RepID=UPI001409DBE8|nr:cytochrome c peroxidase [Flavicella sediminum]